MNNTNILVPNLPESVSNATVAIWNKKTGDQVKQGEILVELETDKIMLEIPAKESGILEIILEQAGKMVTSGQILGKILSYTSDGEFDDKKNTKKESSETVSCLKNNKIQDIQKKDILKKNDNYSKDFSPSARRLIKEYNLQPEIILQSGFFKKITRKNIEKYLSNNGDIKKDSYSTSIFSVNEQASPRTETRVSMTRLRQRIAERLLHVKNNTAMLTTFNEVNMKPIIDLRKKYGEIFEKKYNIRLGFMSFYVKAVLEALRSFPEVNASIDGEDIIYHNYFDISIAVSTERGLVTPVLRNINLFSIADIEKKIKTLADKGKNGRLTLEELSGGNFTITNGGVFGSLMSTPIINPPQSAILGMHAIKDRPMAINGKIIILPMMYLALSYDHRLIDGKDSINFLIKIRDILESPIRFLLEI